MHKYFFLTAGFALLFFAVPAEALSTEISPTVQGFTRGNGAAAETNPYYRKVVESIGKPLLFEKAKILYLIGQIRLSPYDFESQGDFFTGSQAAEYLLALYGKPGYSHETVEEFIGALAVGTSLTDKPYYGLDERGRKRSMPEVLMSELFLLNQKLRDSDLRGIRFRLIHPDTEPPA
jgi:hypothetical protein